MRFGKFSLEDFLGDGQFNLVLREITNGQWFLVSFGMLVVVTVYLISVVREAFKQTIMSPWKFLTTFLRRDLGTQMSIGFFVYLVGSCFRALPTWSMLWAQNHGVDFSPYQAYYDGFISTAAFVAVIGGLCLMRVFSRKRWKVWYWPVVALITVIVPIAVHYYTDFLP